MSLVLALFPIRAAVCAATRPSSTPPSDGPSPGTSVASGGGSSSLALEAFPAEARPALLGSGFSPGCLFSLSSSPSSLSIASLLSSCGVSHELKLASVFCSHNHAFGIWEPFMTPTRRHLPHRSQASQVLRARSAPWPIVSARSASGPSPLSIVPVCALFFERFFSFSPSKWSMASLLSSCGVSQELKHESGFCSHFHSFGI
mmetsp:Transcript_20676/g.63232  ORF Transcript_20676/g.63232 Transcript_20676/m.63232 type:complete len:202 (+) Transcript_20676:1251-1856(+)